MVWVNSHRAACYLYWDLSPGPPAYEASVLTITLTLLVTVKDVSPFDNNTIQTNSTKGPQLLAGAGFLVGVEKGRGSIHLRCGHN